MEPRKTWSYRQKKKEKDHGGSPLSLILVSSAYLRAYVLRVTQEMFINIEVAYSAKVALSQRSNPCLGPFAL